MSCGGGVGSGSLLAAVAMSSQAAEDGGETYSVVFVGCSPAAAGE